MRPVVTFRSLRCGACGAGLAFAQAGFAVSCDDSPSAPVAHRHFRKAEHPTTDILHLHATQEKDIVDGAGLAGTLSGFKGRGGRFLILSGQAVQSALAEVLDALTAGGYRSAAWETFDLCEFGIPASFPTFILVADARTERAGEFLCGRRADCGGSFRQKVLGETVVALRSDSGVTEIIHDDGAPLPLNDDNLKVLVRIPGAAPVLRLLTALEIERLCGYPSNFTLVMHRPGEKPLGTPLTPDKVSHVSRAFMQLEGREPSVAEVCLLLREEERKELLRRSPPPALLSGVATAMFAELSAEKKPA